VSLYLPYAVVSAPLEPKGRLVFKQYLLLKRSRFGIKLYKLCESSTRYVYRFYVYVGKDCSFILPESGNLVPPAEFGATENIVWFLILPLLDQGYRLYVDNFYKSFPLFRMLYQHDTVACGTIRSNRKGYPKILAQNKQVIGQSSALRAGQFLAVRFTDKKDVNMLKTMHSATCTTVAVRRKTVQTLDKPDCILDYNRKMGGVDKSDQLLEPYDATRKCMAWYKKLAIHLLQQALLNAQIISHLPMGKTL